MTAANNRILLVEDDRNFGDVLRSYLEMHDYDVTLATDGEAGLESYNKGQSICVNSTDEHITKLSEGKQEIINKYIL